MDTVYSAVKEVVGEKREGGEGAAWRSRVVGGCDLLRWSSSAPAAGQ